MFYEIIANRFAPKRKDLLDEAYSASHSVCYGACNFHCKFCDFTLRPISAYQKFDKPSFEKVVDRLLLTGKNFKFTGGEPTLNPYLKQHLQIVKQKGGYIYLDSNGSNPHILKDLISENLIDVLGISLKGVTKEECLQITGVAKPEMVWENVFETIKIAAQHKDKLRTIITLVFTEENKNGRLLDFANLMEGFDNIFLKINNLQINDCANSAGMHQVDQDFLFCEIKDFVEKNPVWKNRVIYVPSSQGVSDYSKINFL